RRPETTLTRAASTREADRRAGDRRRRARKARKMSDPIRNWAGNVEFRAARVHRPTTLEELAELVAGAERIRVLGTGHSFNRIADTGGILLRVDALPAEVEIAADRRSATVAAGMRLAAIAD